MYRFQGFVIRDQMLEGVKRYIMNGILPGDFLQAVISNKLVESFSRADDDNARNMKAYAGLLYNHFPLGSYGSKEKMEKWSKDGGISGLWGKEAAERWLKKFERGEQ